MVAANLYYWKILSFSTIYIKVGFQIIFRCREQNIAKLNSNFNSTTTSTWVENSINFVLVHPPTHQPPTRASSDKLQLQLQIQLQIQLQFQLQLLAKLELGTAQPQLVFEVFFIYESSSLVSK